MNQTILINPSYKAIYMATWHEALKQGLTTNEAREYADLEATDKLKKLHEQNSISNIRHSLGAQGS